MKLSVIVLSALISFSATAQNPKPKEVGKPKTTSAKPQKAKKDTLKKQSNKKPRPISSNYCPPCGMG